MKCELCKKECSMTHLYKMKYDDHGLINELSVHACDECGFKIRKTLRAWEHVKVGVYGE